MNIRPQRLCVALLGIILGVLPITGAAQETLGRPGSPIRHFVAVEFNRFPRSVVMRDFCQRSQQPACWRDVRSSGRVWAADVNGDGTEELIIHPGTESGSEGWGFYLYQRRGKHWQSIAGNTGERESGGPGDEGHGDSSGWSADRFRFDILPISRNGYRDMRVSVDLCLKWDGEKYVPYEPADYRALSPSWFDNTNPHEAEIFWMIRYAGSPSVQFEPQWFPITSSFLYHGSDVPRRKPTKDAIHWFRQTGEPPQSPIADLNDTEQNIHWASLSRAGVWGMQGRRGFLLAPRTSYLGSCSLVLVGDWLAGSEACAEYNPETEADFRYNRRTHELQVPCYWMNDGCR